MEQPIRLAIFFLPYKPERVTTPASPAALDSLLDQAWERARSPWPQISLLPKDFMKELAEKLKQAEVDGPLEELLERWYLSDLYLACACMREVPGSKEALEAAYISKVTAWFDRQRLPADERDEALQTLRINLLMGTARSGPRLATYTGQGPLNRWIRISVGRIAGRQGDELRKHAEANSLALAEAIPAPHPDAEIALIQSRHRKEFHQAYREALRELPSEQKLLLQMYFLEELTTTQLGELFGVEQSTIWRRLKNTKEAVYEATKLRLQERLQLSSREFESLFIAIRSQLDASISQILREGHDDEDENGAEKPE